MLKSEGFSYQGYVDIFDAGPAIEAKPARSVRCATARRWCWPSARRATTPPFMIHNRKREDCRITAAPARFAAGTWWSIR
jgi:arginine N-succinyltransferase